MLSLLNFRKCRLRTVCHVRLTWQGHRLRAKLSKSFVAPLVGNPLSHSGTVLFRQTDQLQASNVFPYKLSIRCSNNLVPRCTVRSVLGLSDHRLLRETLLDRSTTLYSNAQGSSFCAISRNDGHILQRQESCYYLSILCLNLAGTFHSQKRIHWSSCQRIAK
jgi:hypothetical protein